jgi:hypothetical protein
MSVPASLRREVIARALERCEYCGLSQLGQQAVFHVDHIIPRIANGPTTVENLALACVSCSLRKGARQSAIDPQTGREAALFNPRHHQWRDHFHWAGLRLIGITPIGRATIAALRLNRPLALAIRAEEALRGRHAAS